jgi:hypothetical protein
MKINRWTEILGQVTWSRRNFAFYAKPWVSSPSRSQTLIEESQRTYISREATDLEDDCGNLR